MYDIQKVYTIDQVYLFIRTGQENQDEYLKATAINTRCATLMDNKNFEKFIKGSDGLTRNDIDKLRKFNQ